MRIPLLVLVLTAAGCSREAKRSPTDGGLAPSTLPSTSATPSPSASAHAAQRVPLFFDELAGEAQRTTVARTETHPVLKPYAALIRAQFGDAPLTMQRTPLAGDRTGVLLETGDETKALFLALDGNSIAWSKERPTAGMTPPARELAISARPNGGAVLFAYDEPTRRVAARIWSADGSPFADIEAMELDACAALSAAYWPGRGHLVVAAAPVGPRAGLLREDGTRAWGEGTDLGVPTRAPSPVTLVIDTLDSFIVVQRVPAKGASTERVLASRYDAHARALWDKPIELGEARMASPKARIAAMLAGEAVVRIELPRAAGPARIVDLTSDGITSQP